MGSIQKTRERTQRLALLAIFTAITAILAYFGGFIKVGSLASIALTLVPIVIGGALCGPKAGAWLGGVAGAIFFLTADAAFWLSLSVHGTIITVMVKGILSGLLAALLYRAFAGRNRYLAVLAAAVVCPIVNTGIFLLGCLVFFMDVVTAGAAAEGATVATYLLVFFVGLNFVFELLANLLLSPAILRIVDIVKGKK